MIFNIFLLDRSGKDINKLRTSGNKMSQNIEIGLSFDNEHDIDDARNEAESGTMNKKSLPVTSSYFDSDKLIETDDDNNMESWAEFDKTQTRVQLFNTKAAAKNNERKIGSDVKNLLHGLKNNKQAKEDKEIWEELFIGEGNFSLNPTDESNTQRSFQNENKLPTTTANKKLSSKMNGHKEGRPYSHWPESVLSSSWQNSYQVPGEISDNTLESHQTDVKGIYYIDRKPTLANDDSVLKSKKNNNLHRIETVEKLNGMYDGNEKNFAKGDNLGSKIEMNFTENVNSDVQNFVAKSLRNDYRQDFWGQPVQSYENQRNYLSQSEQSDNVKQNYRSQSEQNDDIKQNYMSQSEQSDDVKQNYMSQSEQNDDIKLNYLSQSEQNDDQRSYISQSEQYNDDQQNLMGQSEQNSENQQNIFGQSDQSKDIFDQSDQTKNTFDQSAHQNKNIFDQSELTNENQKQVATSIDLSTDVYNSKVTESEDENFADKSNTNISALSNDAYTENCQWQAIGCKMGNSDTSSAENEYNSLQEMKSGDDEADKQEKSMGFDSLRDGNFAKFLNDIDGMSNDKNTNYETVVKIEKEDDKIKDEIKATQGTPFLHYSNKYAMKPNGNNAQQPDSHVVAENEFDINIDESFKDNHGDDMENKINFDISEKADNSYIKKRQSEFIVDIPAARDGLKVAEADIEFVKSQHVDAGHIKELNVETDKEESTEKVLEEVLKEVKTIVNEEGRKTDRPMKLSPNDKSSQGDLTYEVDLLPDRIVNHKFRANPSIAKQTDDIMKRKRYYMTHSLMSWPLMSSFKHRSYQYGFPLGTTMANLFNYHGNGADQQDWAGIFVASTLLRLIRNVGKGAGGEKRVIDSFWKFVTWKMDVLKQKYFDRHKTLPSVEDLVKIKNNT